MPEWLAILIGVLGGIASATTILRIWLNPLFKIREDVDENAKNIAIIMEHQKNDYKARVRSDNIQKAVAKAMVALLNDRISGDNIDKMKETRTELQDAIMEHL